ncbi:cytidine deaminase [Vibrio sp. SS-MA-C1-2]|uniref:cytidine deaminase n=1 Tax=Vibrio sp. SS-MA-C1-2 TaxID=2908646 RepID=UPI001F19421F|nr:cytidine deaminase [Vibrio sp. SS-MA-C1-2]UJF16983.1 cytidine deaminase [Vibrio sp. SS-MA-C1-2]
MRPSVTTALKALPIEIQNYLTPIMDSEDFDATISVEQFNQLLALSQLSDADLRVLLLPLAAAYSVTPISNFHVGALARGLSGKIYFGANMEMTGIQLGQTVHAEQSAISHAWNKGETGISDITINYSPCGHCRQFMNELTMASKLKIQLPKRDPKLLHEYLPEAFGPADLGIKDGLMTVVDHQLKVDSDSTLLQAACKSANISHSPYTKNPSGVAIKANDGCIFTGMYAENAAFNPSLPPLQVALNAMNMANYEFDQIDRVALVETSTGSSSHLQGTQDVVNAIKQNITVEYRAV